MDDRDSTFPDPDILWSEIREAECNAPEDRPVVLVVEDDPTTRMVIRHAVRAVVRTDAAGRVSDALRMAEAVPYDGLLVDLNLPDENGMEIVTELQGRTPYWGVPMVAVTAHALPKGEGSFLERGLDAYVAKPVERAALRRLVQHLMVDADDAVDKGRKLIHRDTPSDQARETPSSGTTARPAPTTQSMQLPEDVDDFAPEEAA